MESDLTVSSLNAKPFSELFKTNGRKVIKTKYKSVTRENVGAIIEENNIIEGNR